MTVSPTPGPSGRDERHVVLSDPGPGTIVELPAGSQLAVRFRRRLGSSRWLLASLPSHLLALVEGEHDFQFLVFGCPDGTTPVRFERRHPGREIAHEVCEVLVVPVSRRGRGAGRTSRLASPRSA